MEAVKNFHSFQLISTHSLVGFWSQRRWWACPFSSGSSHPCSAVCPASRVRRPGKGCLPPDRWSGACSGWAARSSPRRCSRWPHGRSLSCRATRRLAPIRRWCWRPSHSTGRTAHLRKQKNAGLATRWLIRWQSGLLAKNGFYMAGRFQTSNFLNFFQA